MIILSENNINMNSSGTGYYEFMYELTDLKMKLFESTVNCDIIEINQGVLNEGVLSNVKDRLISLWKLLIKKINECIAILRRKTNKGTSNKDSYNPATYEPLNKEIENENITGIRSKLKTVITMDITFEKGLYDKTVKYILSKGIDIDKLYDKHDNEPFNNNKNEWTIKYFNEVMTDLLFNFSKERIDQLRQISKYMRSNSLQIKSKLNKHISEYVEVSKSLDINRGVDIDKLSEVIESFPEVKELLDKISYVNDVDVNGVTRALENCRKACEINMRNANELVEDKSNEVTKINNKISKVIEQLVFISSTLNKMA